MKILHIANPLSCFCVLIALLLVDHSAVGFAFAGGLMNQIAAQIANQIAAATKVVVAFSGKTSVVDRNGAYVCPVKTYYKEKYDSNPCWEWDGYCTAYRKRSRTKYNCCSGWVSNNGKQCNVPICNNKPADANPSPCSKNVAANQIIVNGRSVTASGGRCYYPNGCSSCNTGFYPSGSYCELCRQIGNCDIETCTSGSDSKCARCASDHGACLGCTAYRNLGSECRQRCSWKSDSTPCWPGTCGSASDMLRTSCRCHQDFEDTKCFGSSCGSTTYKCRKIKTYPMINAPSVKLLDRSNGATQKQNDPNDNGVQTIYTNGNNIRYLSVQYTTEWKPSASFPTRPAFITDFTTGISSSKVAVQYISSGGSARVLTCTGGSIKQGLVRCDVVLDVMQVTANQAIRDRAILQVKIHSSNGARLTLKDMDTNAQAPGHGWSGYYDYKTNTRTVLFKFDQYPPYCNAGTYRCLRVDDDHITGTRATFRIRWTSADWRDDFSGIDKAEIKIMNMIKTGNQVKEYSHIQSRDVSPSAQYDYFTSTTTGVYSIIFYMYDKAGNYRTARRLVFHDAGTAISLQGGTSLAVVGASGSFITNVAGGITVQYTNRYINQGLVTGGWLNQVQDFPGVINAYDDLDQGLRTKNAVNNLNGITKFEVGYQIFKGANPDPRGSGIRYRRETFVDDTTTRNDYTSTFSTKPQDGSAMQVFVRATDYADHQYTESVTIQVDTSPPVIRNLGLVRDGKTGLAIHNMEEFTEMTFEWQVFDQHSGLKSVTWVLYDNYTTIITYGTQSIGNNMYSTLDQCGKPQSCYCAENQPGGVSRCFNMDFSVKPQVSSGNGLNADTASGRHDAEYFIGIQAENWAGLTSNFEMMITIDASPPHVGIVHDGLASDIKKEVDFQQSYSLAAHWDGFLDRESGVRSYSYVFGTSCLDAQNFPYTTAQSLSHDRREATWRAPGPGRYYVTVVAYNAAFSPSEPVCSDGVLVDTTRPVVSELGMKSIAMKAGLMKKSETKVYYLQENGLKMKIDNPSTMCRTKALYFPGGTDKFSFDREHDGSIKTIDGSGSFCQDKLPLSATFSMGLTQDKMIEAWWSGSDPESGIRHYEVALASRPGDEDIMAFEKVARGTTGYYKKYHPGLEEGKVFYFIVRGTNQAMLQATQAFGPFIVDVVVPTYSGAIMPYMDAGVLMVAYDKSKFDDGEDADTLTLEFAVGTRKGATDVISWHPLVDGAPCKMKAPSHCTTIQTSSGDDFVQGKTYYVSLQATNAVGRSVVVTADPLVHFMDKPSEGVVMDTEVVQGMASVMLPDIFTTNWARFKEDVDYQTIDNQIDAKWYGFERPLLKTSYMVGLGDAPGTDNVVKFTSVRQQTKYRFRWIPLKSFVRYYTTVIATNDHGETRMTSDGVMILRKGAAMDAITVKDGRRCDQTFGNQTCLDEIDYQVSSSVLSAHWDIPENFKPFIANVHWAIEENIDPTKGTKIGWKPFEPYLSLKMADNIIKPGLAMVSGRQYRSKVQFCYGTVCYDLVYSDGVLIQSKPPAPGQMEVVLIPPLVKGGEIQLNVIFDKFEDLDIPEIYPDIAKSVVDRYEWSVSGINGHGSVTEWKEATVVSVNGTLAEFFITLGNVTREKGNCPRFALRGFTKAMMSTTIYKVGKYCEFSKILHRIRDVIGSPVDGDGQTSRHRGEPINLQTVNMIDGDADFTAYTNILSAVFPSLPKRAYHYAVIYDEDFDAFTFYKKPDKLKLRDPCSLPTSIRCGEIDDGEPFINIEFEEGYLQHGRMYFICLYAANVTVDAIGGVQHLPEFYECSDGITVDNTAPIPGRAWVGFDRPLDYLSTSNELFVSWDPFDEPEECHGSAAQNAGIQFFEYAIGAHYGESDIRDWVNVGVTDHARIHGLQLQDGHNYYITIRATNFAGLSSQSTTNAVTIDRSPPITTKQGIRFASNYHTSTEEMRAVWEDIFRDDESFVDYYEWAVGSEEGYADIMPYTKTKQEFGEYPNSFSTESEPLHLQEGHAYYVSVKAYNGAGLSTLINSWPTIVDASPPVPGLVYDGLALGRNLDEDSDYQTDPHTISASWKGFEDPHSGILAYKWSVGSCPGCADKVEEHPVGIMTYATAEHLELLPGHVYYVTVKACNGAGMCSDASSDGIIMDNSPPIPGVVSDGTDPEDSDFQFSRGRLAAKWWGFVDPQSGIKQYSWWAGTTKGGTEIFPEEPLHHFEEAYRTVFPNGDLPEQTMIYITVKATNNAGLSAIATSNGIKVDQSPPVFTKNPELRDDMGVVYPNTQVFKTILRVWWESDDPESNIEEQYVFISTHENGEVPAPTKLIEGVLMEHTFVDLDLHDGNEYSVTVTACNLAKACTSAVSQVILVDHSPPTTGMFTVDTHSGVSRQVQETTMRWNANTLTLGWLGFSDLHSGIKHYELFVGTTFEGWELTGNEMVTINHSDLDVQRGTITTSSALSDDQQIYVTIVAVNKVGLKSPPFKKKFVLINGGEMDLVRRCEPETCMGDCICAKEGERCPNPTTACNPTANEIAGYRYRNGDCGGRDIKNIRSTTLSVCEAECNKDTRCKSILWVSAPWNYCWLKWSACLGALSASHLSQLHFYTKQVMVTELIDTLDLQGGVGRKYSPSKCLMAARWNVFDENGYDPVRYDFSAGLAGRSEPSGIFDPSHDIVWHDVGKAKQAILTLEPAKYLHLDVEYKIFVRAWFPNGRFLVYSSDGIIQDDKAPVLGKLQGAEVKDCAVDDQGVPIQGTIDRDVDITTNSRFMCTSWKHRFHESSTAAFNSFFVSIGSYPGGGDVQYFFKHPDPSMTSLKTNLTTSLKPGRRYYSSIVAYNNAGLCTMSYSDGLVLDQTPPTTGIVYDGHGLHDAEYQNSTDTISAHWRGFVDLESYIDHYMWCVGPTAAADDCGLVPWKNVGLHTRASAKVDLTHGVAYYNKVVAVDEAGHESAAEVSDGVTIDATPPVVMSKLQYGDNLLKNPSFEEDSGRTGLLYFNQQVPTKWTVGQDYTVAAILGYTKLAKDGQKLLILFGAVTQKIHGLIIGEKYRVIIHASQIYPSPSPNLVQHGRVVLPDRKEYIFQLNQRASRPDVNGKEMISFWQRYSFYFYATNTSGDFTIASVGVTNAVLFDAISIVETQDDGWTSKRKLTDNHPLSVRGIFTNDWNSVHVAWDFEDNESPIVDYTWAIGTQRGDVQLQGFTSVGTETCGESDHLELGHTSVIYVTVIATNAAGLKTAHLSDRITLDLTPPVFSYLYDGDSDEDIDFQSSLTVKAHWNVSDPESGIDYCQYGIGKHKYVTNILQLTDLPPGIFKFETNLPVESRRPFEEIFVTVRCFNLAGEESTASSDGLTVGDKPPTTDDAEVTIIEPSLTQFPSRGPYSSVRNKIFLSWSGFKDSLRIAEYEVNLRGNKLWRGKSTHIPNGDRMYAEICGLDLGDGERYSALVQAENGAGMESDFVERKFLLDSEEPKITNGSNIQLAWTIVNEVITISWRGLFNSSSPLSYEISWGTAQSGADVIQWQESTDEEIDLLIPIGYLAIHPSYLTITAINSAGLYKTKMWTVIVDGELDSFIVSN